MNTRQKKKKDKEAIKLARKIHSVDEEYCGRLTYWERNSSSKRANRKFNKKYYMSLEERYDYKMEQQAREMLLKVCRKCIKDGFPLEEYYLFEIPYSDKNGWMMDFVNIKDFEDYHTLGKEDTKIREIDFWCPQNLKMAIPQGMDGSTQYDCETCFEAVYDD